MANVAKLLAGGVKGIAVKVLTFHTGAWGELRAAPMPDASWADSDIPQDDPDGLAPLGLTSPLG